MSKMVWAKRKTTTRFAANAFELRRGGVVLAIVQEAAAGWFSYGLGGMSWNTTNDPKPLHEAKAEAMRLARKASQA